VCKVNGAVRASVGWNLSPSILAVNPARGNAFARAVQIGFARGGSKADFPLIFGVGVARTPEIQLQLLPRKPAASPRRIAHLEALSRILPVVGIGQPADEDREEIDLWIHVLPDRHPPKSANRSPRFGG